MPSLLLLLASACLLLSSAWAAIQSELRSWTLEGQARDGTHLEAPFESPGYVLQALQRVGAVGSLFAPHAEQDSAWVRQAWTLRHDALVPASALQHAVLDLELLGVDAPAELNATSVCGALHAEWHNSFRSVSGRKGVAEGNACVTPSGAELPNTAHLHAACRVWRVDLTRLKACATADCPLLITVSLTLLSAEAFAQRRADAYPDEVPSMLAPGMLPHYNFMRKAASDFGWDWGPAFAPVGLSDAVHLRAYSRPFIVRASFPPSCSFTRAVTADAALCRRDISEPPRRRRRCASERDSADRSAARAAGFAAQRHPRAAPERPLPGRVFAGRPGQHGLQPGRCVHAP